MTKTYTHSNLTDRSSMMVKGDKELESKIGKAELIKGQGPDNVKDLEDPDEDKKYSDGAKAKDMTKESSSYEGAFERLFKATINEEEEMEMKSDEMPVSGDEMVDEIEDTEEQESNLISDLQNVMSQLQGILDKLSEEDTEEESEEKVEEEVESEESTEEEDESDEPYEESMDFTQKSHMKVSGKIHSSKGTAHKGDFKPSPHPKPHKNKGEFLRSKGAMKVKSSVTPGDFFK